MAPWISRPQWWRFLALSDNWISFGVLGGGSLLLKTLPLHLATFLSRSAPRVRRQGAVLLASLAFGLGAFTVFVWAPTAFIIAPPANPQWGSLLSMLYPLSISEETVKNYIANIFAKLHVYDRTQAMVYAIRKGLVKV